MINNGIDIVYIEKIKKMTKNEKVLKKIFTENELLYIKDRNYNINTIAGIYAAKEAFLKAFKKGINNYNLKDIEISHNEENAPFIILHNRALKECNYTSLSLSISHDKDYAIASVLAVI